MLARASWGLMTLLAIGVAGYAFALVLVPATRGDFVRDMLTSTPISAHAHFLGGGVALVLGAFQFSKTLRARFLNVHRWSGRVYVTACLASGLAALYMALSTPGGPPAQLGFSLLAILWLYSTTQAFLRIRAGDVRAHQAWMIRSYSLTLAAVTLRFYLPISLANGIPFEMAYTAIAWLCWVPNLIIAEWWFVNRQSRAA